MHHFFLQIFVLKKILVIAVILQAANGEESSTETVTTTDIPTTETVTVTDFQEFNETDKVERTTEISTTTEQKPQINGTESNRQSKNYYVYRRDPPKISRGSVKYTTSHQGWHNRIGTDTRKRKIIPKPVRQVADAVKTRFTKRKPLRDVPKTTHQYKVTESDEKFGERVINFSTSSQRNFLISKPGRKKRFTVENCFFF